MAYPVDHPSTAPAALDHANMSELHLVTVDDLCRLWHVKKSWVYDAVKRGVLPAVRLGKQLRFRPIEIEAFLRQSSS